MKVGYSFINKIDHFPHLLILFFHTPCQPVAPLPQRQGPVGEEAGPKSTSHSESGSSAEIEALRCHIEELMQENDGLRTKVEMSDEFDAEYRINPDEHIRGEPELRAKLHQAERAITTLKKRLVESECY